MRPATPRKLTILDAMILVAAVACGFPLGRATAGVVYYDGPGHEQNVVARCADRPVRAVLPFLMTLTTAALFIRLRRPRPRWRRLARQPGMAACCAAVVPIAFVSIGFAGLKWQLEPNATLWCGDWRADPLFGGCGYLAGVWVLTTWLVLALGRRWRAERSAIDRLGRIVGVAWLAVLALWILGTRLLTD
jgi:hypothetical protein